MSYKTCAEWPELMELAPDLQFKHLSVQEAQLPFEVVAKIPASIPLDETEICCDVDSHVFNAAHTHPAVCEALADTHWYEVHEWATTGPGSGSSSSSDAHAA